MAAISIIETDLDRTSKMKRFKEVIRHRRAGYHPAPDEDAHVHSGSGGNCANMCSKLCESAGNVICIFNRASSPCQCWCFIQCNP